MAVIKIVPMPGAVGDKGDEGAPGPQGQQGPAGQNGLPGTPALWSYQGAYNPAAAYAVGDVVVYQGQLYYTKSVTTAGTLPTNTTKFDLIAAKGADGTNGTNGTNGADGAPGVGFGIFYLGNYNPNSGYVPDIAVVRGSDGQLYLAKASGQLGDPVGNTAQWEVWIPKGQDGAPGATPFTLIGAYDNGASYNLGIAVYYNGGTYVRTGNPLNPGYPPTLGAVNESWTPIAEKGADGSQLNYWDGASVPQDPAEDGFLIVDGIVATNGSNILVSADDRVFIGGNNGEFLNGLSTPENQIATIGDLTTPTSGTWDARMAELSGVTISSDTNSANYRIYNANKLGSYYCVGDLVHIDFRTVIYQPDSWEDPLSFGGTSFVFALPFPVYYAPATPDDGSGSSIKNSLNRNIIDGYLRITADANPSALSGQQISAENYPYQDNELHVVNAKAILRTLAINPTTNLPTLITGAQLYPAESPKIGIAFIHIEDQSNPESWLTNVAGYETYPGNTNTMNLRPFTKSWPAPLQQALNDMNAQSGTTNQNSIQLNFTGVYRKA